MSHLSEPDSHTQRHTHTRITHIFAIPSFLAANFSPDKQRIPTQIHQMKQIFFSCVFCLPFECCLAYTRRLFVVMMHLRTHFVVSGFAQPRIYSNLSTELQWINSLHTNKHSHTRPELSPLIYFSSYLVCCAFCSLQQTARARKKHKLHVFHITIHSNWNSPVRINGRFCATLCCSAFYRLLHTTLGHQSVKLLRVLVVSTLNTLWLNERDNSNTKKKQKLCSENACLSFSG